MPTAFQLRQIKQAVYQGQVIAYPTEAVFGLGCDPLNYQSVARILQIKQRHIDKGLILIASDFSQLRPFVKSLEKSLTQPAFDSWPGPNTWLFPARESTPYWLTGKYTSIAVRLSAHPVVKKLCDEIGMPLVSTSANRSKHKPARSALECRFKCPEVDLIVPGAVNRDAQPSTIRDLLTGSVIRA